MIQSTASAASTASSAHLTASSATATLSTARTLIPTATLIERVAAAALLLSATLLAVPLAALLATAATAATTTAAILSTATLALTAAAATLCVRTAARLHLCLLLDHVDDLIRDAQILDGVAADVALGHAPEAVAILRNSIYQLSETAAIVLRIRTFDVQITSRRCTFIQVSQLTRCPL